MPAQRTLEILCAKTESYVLRSHIEMSDDKTKVGPQDRSRINMNEKYEVDYWAKRFGVTVERLRAAVDKVGTSVKDVEADLKR